VGEKFTGMSESPKAYFEKKLLPSIKAYMAISSEEEKQLQTVFHFYEKQIAESGNDFVRITEVIELLIELRADVSLLLLGLLSEFSRRPSHDVGLLEIQEKVPEETKRSLTSMRYIQGILQKNQGKNFDYQQKIIISQASDFRVLLALLAQRRVDLRYVKEETKTTKLLCQETLGVQVPLASRLGLYKIKSELEDTCLKYLYPDHYRSIAEQIGHKKCEREAFLVHAIAEIKDLLSEHRLDFIRVDGRVKNLYSVYKKVKTKRYTDLSDVFDLIALRIIVADKNTCYQTLGAIHTRWTPLYQRFKDYIAIPKSNGYRSIHTTVLGLAHRKLPTEIQIRTEAMHLESEYGMTAHWSYKGITNVPGAKKSHETENSPTISTEKNLQGQFAELAKSLKKSRIMVFTPQGDIKHLPEKATPVDFAYAVHSDVGDTCTGAKVNGLIRPLDFELKKGDIVEILTKKERHPNPDWLKFVKTSHAKGHVKKFINRQRAEIAAETSEDNFSEKNIPGKKFDLKPRPKASSATKPSPEITLVIGGEKGLPYRLATCCAPKITQDEIIAVSNRGLSFVIHKSTCKDVPHISQNHVLDAYCLITKTLEIASKDRMGLIADTTSFFQQNQVNVLDFSVRTEEDQAYQRLSIQVHSEPEFFGLLEKLKKAVKVESVTELE
jgi:guanosine-3',5'-bis(diphosphate) 3'-pyrophosphohydrolase